MINLITLCDQADHILWSSWSQNVIKEVITMTYLPTYYVLLWSHFVINLITLCDQLDHKVWSNWSQSVITFVIKICDQVRDYITWLIKVTNEYIFCSRDWSKIIIRDGWVPFRGSSLHVRHNKIFYYYSILLALMTVMPDGTSILLDEASGHHILISVRVRLVPHP